MRTKLSIFLPLLLLCLMNLRASGQESKSHKIYFDNVNGFSGYVEFTTKHVNSPTRIHAYDKGLVLKSYNTNRENLGVLLNAGYDLRGMTTSGVTPLDYGYEVTGRAFIVNTFTHMALADSKFHLSNGLDDYRTIDFDENAKQAAKEWGENNNHVFSYWEKFGGFDNPKVVRLYLTDFKNEIDRILRKHESEKQQFAQLIAQATSSANQYDFSVAENVLSNALSLVGDNSDMKNEADRVAKLIAKKKAEKEKQEVEKKESASGSSSNSKETGKDDKEDKNKEKPKAKTKTIEDYAFEAEIKGDAALRRGDFKAALQNYNDAEKMGRLVDNTKMNKAIDGTLSQSFEELGRTVAPHLSDFFDQASGGFAAIQGLYAPMHAYGSYYSLGINYHGYWKYFCMEMGLGLNYIDSTDFWVYDPYFTLSNPSSSQGTKVSDDQIVFREVNKGKIEYKGYKHVRNSFNMNISAGLGFNIPFRNLKPNFMLVGFYNPGIGDMPNLYGYKYLIKIDFWRKVILGFSYNNYFYSNKSFHGSYLSHPYKNRTLADLDKLFENNINNKFHSIEFSIGFKFIDND